MAMGIYSDGGLKRLIDNEIILSDGKIEDDQIQPSSLDMKIGNEVYCMPYSSVSFKGNFESFLSNNNLYKFNLEDNGFLHKGSVYVVKLQERVSLPKELIGRANPKSSSGRIDVHVRMLTDDGGAFDSIPSGYNGNLWLEIYSRSFNLSLNEGTSLNQLRIMDNQLSSLGDVELECLQREDGLLSVINDGKPVLLDAGKSRDLIRNGRVYTTLELDADNPGFVAKSNAPLLDLSKRNLPASAYFDKIRLDGSGFVVDSDSFYILSTEEAVNIPTDHCAEMVDVETISGEFRSHYAGFFDPGFFSQATLELRNYGQPFLLSKDQRIASLVYHRLKELPERDYGSEGVVSHYQGQKGPSLAKFFDSKK